MEPAAVITWAVVQQLIAGQQFPAGVARDVALAHGLDLPHLPGLVRVADRPGTWAVHCLGCTLRSGHLEPRCRSGHWQGPATVVDDATVATLIDDVQRTTAGRIKRQLDQVVAVVADRPEQRPEERAA